MSIVINDSKFNPQYQLTIQMSTYGIAQFKIEDIDEIKQKAFRFSVKNLFPNFIGD